MYEQARRCAENTDKHGAGLARFLAAATRENAKRHAGQHREIRQPAALVLSVQR